MRLSIAQQRAIYSPVSRRDDLRNIHHHQYKDVHGRTVTLSLTISRYQSILLGRPCWDCRVSLGNGKHTYRLTNDRFADAYAAAVIALMGCGEDVEYINRDSGETTICLRVTLTDEEREMMRNLNDGEDPDLYPIDLPIQNEQPRPDEHRVRQAWMDKALGEVFDTVDVKDPTKQMVKGVTDGNS